MAGRLVGFTTCVWVGRYGRLYSARSIHDLALDPTCVPRGMVKRCDVSDEPAYKKWEV